jgi:hypothetical protein
MPPTIEFLGAAREKLKQRVVGNPARLEAKQADIAARLAVVFPKARALSVQNVYQGYRVHEDEYVLLVEVAYGEPNGERDSSHVVKLGDPAELRDEFNAWRNCQPGGRHDLVLMAIDPRPDATAPVGLVYDDAQQFIGVDATLPLEDVMLEYARTGSPRHDSVAEVLFHLYERLGIVLYKYSGEWQPPKAENLKLEGKHEPVPTKDTPESREVRNQKVANALNLGRHFLANLDAWDPPALRGILEPDQLRHHLCFTMRCDVQRFAKDPKGTKYRDACGVFRAILNHIANGGEPADYVPIILRGHAHGDLHGRNVLLGHIKNKNRVLWPAVYDHEHMSRDNIVALDFVKLEFEFKIRAYTELFPGKAREAVPKILQFEHEVFKETETCRENEAWPERPTSNSHPDRLKWQILKVREAAARHLGDQKGRPRKWLAEYYFLLALYGLNSIRFENLRDHELRAAYTAAGAAAARFAYSWKPPTRSVGAAPHPDPLSYHAELQLACRWKDGNKTDEGAVSLTMLRGEYPYAIDVRHELVHVMEKRGNLEDARREFTNLETTFGDLDDEESLCRGGKIHKRLADHNIAIGMVTSALEDLERAADYYRRAFEVGEWFFPGENWLAVRLLQAQFLALLEKEDPTRKPEAAGVFDAVRTDAKKLINNGQVWKHRIPDDTIWAPASMGAVSLLAGKEKVAETAYSEAKRAADNKAAYYCGIMSKQLENIVAALAELGSPVQGVLREPSKFFGLATPTTD